MHAGAPVPAWACMQELQSGADKGVGLAGMKAIKTHMRDIIVTDGKGTWLFLLFEVWAGPVGGTYAATQLLCILGGRVWVQVSE